MGIISSCLSNIMYITEKISLWLTCVGLISCIILMFVVTLGLGIGLGYNYCFVDLRTKYKHVHSKYRFVRNKLEDTSEYDLGGVTFVPEDPPTGSDFFIVDQAREATEPESTEENNITTTSEIPTTTSSELLPTSELLRTADQSDKANTTNTSTSQIPLVNSSIVPDEEDKKIKNLIIPISGVDLINLLSKLNGANQNYSLHIVTT